MEGSLVYQISAAEYITGEGDSGDWLSLQLIKRFAAETYTESGAITIARTVPDLDYFCENENRLWGVKAKEIFACNWETPLTGMSSLGYPPIATVWLPARTAISPPLSLIWDNPVLLKPDAIHKVYGTKPTNFQPMHSPMWGWRKAAAAAQPL